MASGGKRSGAGRPKGSSNKLKVADLESVKQGISPIEYLASIYQDENQDQRDRIDAAKAAAPYVHAKLSSVEMNANVNLDHESALDELEGEGSPEEA